MKLRQVNVVKQSQTVHGFLWTPNFLAMQTYFDFVKVYDKAVNYVLLTQRSNFESFA